MKIIKLITEDSTIFKVGEDGVLEIKEHRPMGEGDKWFYDVFCEDKVVRIFNPMGVIFNIIKE